MSRWDDNTTLKHGRGLFEQGFSDSYSDALASSLNAEKIKTGNVPHDSSGHLYRRRIELSAKLADRRGGRSLHGNTSYMVYMASLANFGVQRELMADARSSSSRMPRGSQTVAHSVQREPSMFSHVSFPHFLCISSLLAC